MAGKQSREKGARGERRACRLLGKITGEEWKRTPGGDVQFAGDIVPTGAVCRPWDRCLVEVKNYGNVRIEHLLFPTKRELGWLDKAEGEARAAGDRWPCLVVWVAGRGGVLVVLTDDIRGGFWDTLSDLTTWRGEVVWDERRPDGWPRGMTLIGVEG